MKYVDQNVEVPDSVAAGAVIKVHEQENKWLEIPSAGAFVGTVVFEGRRNLTGGPGAGPWVPLVTQVDSPASPALVEIPEPIDEIRGNTTAYTSGDMVQAIIRGGIA